MFDFTNDRMNLCLLLLDGFSMLSLGAILEPMQFLATEHPSLAPRVNLTALSGRKAISKGGTSVDCDYDLTVLSDKFLSHRSGQVILICGPTDEIASNQKELRLLLRKANLRQIPICGIGAVAMLMAEVGILPDKKCSIHWRSLASFAETHTTAVGENALFVAQGFSGSCAGESATLDLTVNLISSISPLAAEEVVNYFLMSAPRYGDSVQPGSQRFRLRNAPVNLTNAVQLMSEHIEQPKRVRDIAKACKISPRAMERMFRNHLGVSPGRYYIFLRLERALELLTKTNLSILEVAIASGFSSTSTLRQHFIPRYGESPTQRRKRCYIK